MGLGLGVLGGVLFLDEQPLLVLVLAGVVVVGQLIVLGSLLTVESPASGISDSHGVTGGVYKTRERIHRDMLIRDY